MSVYLLYARIRDEWMLVGAYSTASKAEEARKLLVQTEVYRNSGDRTCIEVEAVDGNYLISSSQKDAAGGV